MCGAWCRDLRFVGQRCHVRNEYVRHNKSMGLLIRDFWDSQDQVDLQIIVAV